MIEVDDLLNTAHALARRGASDAELRRSISAAYYAMFHFICREFAGIVTRIDETQFQRAWLQAYRYLDHGPAKQRCIEVVRQGRDFPDEFQAFAGIFVELQDLRIAADYDPTFVVDANLAFYCAGSAAQAILDLSDAPAEHVRAFVLFV